MTQIKKILVPLDGSENSFRGLSEAIYLAVLSAPVFAGTAQTGDLEHGRIVYEVCAACHGEQAEGNKELYAPALAGKESWYLHRQLDNFRIGLRGYSNDDNAGIQMRYAIKGQVNDQDVADVSAYIAGLPTLPNTWPEVSGDPSAGRGYYMICGACHGKNGEGNPSIGAPRLTGLEGWYFARQLVKFKNGLRGAHVDDAFGNQMQEMAALLPDDQAMADIIAYVFTLGQEGAK